jgi:tripartite ATP-independent transporter DctP family solute receptor
VRSTITLTRLIAAGAALAGLVGLAAAGSAQTVLRYAHVGADGEAQTRYATELAALVKQKTEGRLDVRVFPGSQLGNISEMVNGVRIGSVAMAHHDFSSLDRIVEDVSVFNAPFIYRDSRHAMRATDEKTSPVLQEINKQLVEKGSIRIVGNFYRGARQLSAKFPVKSPSDLKGKKIRGVPLKLWNTMLGGMGAIPTPVEITELMTALSTGLVDGQENPLNNIIAQRFYEVQPYIMMTSHMESVLALFVNERVWQGLPAKDRGLFQEAIAEMAQRSLTWADESVKKDQDFLRSKNVTFIEAKDGLDLGAFRTAVTAQLAKDFPGWTGHIQRIQAIQ